MEPEFDHAEPTGKLALPDVVKAVFTDYVGFARRYLTAPQPPLMLIVMWLIGMEAVAGGIDLSFAIGEQYALDNWFHAWLQIILVGFAMGVMRYWLVGSLFHLVVLAAGGKGTSRTSRYILLYALLPASICNLSVKVLQMLVYQNQYFGGQRYGALEGLLGTVMMGMYVFTLVLCYRGMRALQGTDRNRSIFILAALSLAMVVLSIISLGG